MSNQDSSEAPSKGHYFELLDRAHVAPAYFQMAFDEHPVLLKHPEPCTLYEEAVDRLETLYQAVGQIEETWT